MEAVEDIPGTALHEGLNWEWESFPEYLDALERLPRTIDVAAQIPHHPLRVYVMGERGIGREAATPEDIDTMRRLTEEALRAGAFGFTTSRTYSHKTKTGELVPAHGAEEAELTGIGRAMGAVGAGAFGMNSDFEDEAREFAWMTRLSKETGRPVWFLLTDRPTDPERWRRLMRGVHQARAAGGHVTAQVAGRPVGVILGHNTSMNPFTFRPAYRGARQSAGGRALGPAARPGGARRASSPSRRPRRELNAAGPVHPLCRDPLGPHVRDGRARPITSRPPTRASPRSPPAPTTRRTRSPTTT